MSLITIIGRGHSGTRAISHTLSQSGAFMGRQLNESGDLIPPEEMYEACRILGKQVEWRGDLKWDFNKVLEGGIDSKFQKLIRSYLGDVLASRKKVRGWKIPETTLAYPWIVRMYPQVRYIFWIRNPLDCILGEHVTDDLHDFNIDYPQTEDEIERRAISWKYQYDLVASVPRPEHWIEVRFEDFVEKQEETLLRLESFLGFELARIPVNSDPIDRWKRIDHPPRFDFLRPAMQKFSYKGPWDE